METTPTNRQQVPKTLADLLEWLEQSSISGTRHRDMVSAVKRICDMAGRPPATVPTDPAVLRELLGKIRPAAHNIDAKTFSNLKSLLTAALLLAQVIEPLGRGQAKHDPVWGPLFKAVSGDRRLSEGLAAFANWCVGQGIPPGAVDDGAVPHFQVWLETRTLHPKPRDLVRRVPNLWNRASVQCESWPKTSLTKISFKSPPKHLLWSQLNPSFRRDADAYLELRGKPDVFEERPNAPRRPLAASTLRQQREHLRLAASILTKGGEDIASLADLVTPARFKTILFYYINQADGAPNAFAVGISKTLMQVAQYYSGAKAEEVAAIKGLASKLPTLPSDLTEKNKRLLRQLESERLRAKLLFLAEELMAKVAKDLAQGRVRVVEAQVAIAIDILLALPLRSQNLIALNWHHNFSEPNGPKGKLQLYIPAKDTKSRKHDIVSELPDEVALHIRWYRRQILPRLGADLNGPLFVTLNRSRKSQATLTVQITAAIKRHVGIDMTPHQFRHFAAVSYLEQHPEDFETVRALLGHAWSKTTRIYAGSSTRRASRAYNKHLLGQREELKFQRRPRKQRS